MRRAILTALAVLALTGCDLQGAGAPWGHDHVVVIPGPAYRAPAQRPAPRWAPMPRPMGRTR